MSSPDPAEPVNHCGAEDKTRGTESRGHLSPWEGLRGGGLALGAECEQELAEGTHTFREEDTEGGNAGSFLSRTDRTE